VIACRVTFVPEVSLEIDNGPSLLNRKTSRRRVSSPSAANTSAEFFGRAASLVLGLLGKVFLDDPNHNAPALLVCRKRLRAASKRDLIEP
jgi:hypothetical protein